MQDDPSRFAGFRLRVTGESVSRQRVSDGEVGAPFHRDTRGRSRSRGNTIAIQEADPNFAGRTRHLLHPLARDYRQSLIVQGKAIPPVYYGIAFDSRNCNI